MAELELYACSIYIYICNICVSIYVKKCDVYTLYRLYRPRLLGYVAIVAIALVVLDGDTQKMPVLCMPLCH